MNKAKECNKCGCARTILITPKVLSQKDEEWVEYSYKRLCLPCFLGMFEFFNSITGQVDMKMVRELAANH